MPTAHNSAAFDAVAEAYDDQFTNTAIGRAQRERVWHFLREIKSRYAFQNVLECNCGTGVDAEWLAGQGASVVATDVSPEMVAITRKRALNSGIQLQTAVCKLQDIDTQLQVLEMAPYDVLFSNFGGLNCLSPEEIRHWNDQLKSILTERGILALVVMSRFSWWETLYFLAKGKVRQAFRRFSQSAVYARLDADTAIATWYYGPRELAALLPDFEIKKRHPVGFWLPPSYLEPFFRRFPKWLQALNRLEKKWAAAWLAPASDHFFILLERKRSRA